MDLTNDCHPVFDGLLRRCVELNASDIHITSAVEPYYRVDNAVVKDGEESISSTTVAEIVESLLTPQQWEVLRQEMSIDVAFFWENWQRFRVNVFYQRNSLAMAIRRLDDKYRSFAELHLPSRLSELAEYPHGLVIVTGPTGSGKSTTLATVINEINLRRQGHVITIEDPIEYVHRNKQCLIQQRQLYTDVPSFASAVRAALREDPDVLLVGEMRDMATIRAAVTAAETGHLVFSTLHTGEAIGAIDRMISVFPAEEQVAVRDQLSRVLRCVVSQRLVARADNHGRVPAVEIMQVTDAVSNLIRIGQSNQIESVMQTGGTEGMMILEQSLAELTARRLIAESEAATIARDRNVYASRLAVAQKMFKAQAL